MGSVAPVGGHGGVGGGLRVDAAGAAVGGGGRRRSLEEIEREEEIAITNLPATATVVSVKLSDVTSTSRRLVSRLS